jgi:hypothetical protein
MLQARKHAPTPSFSTIFTSDSHLSLLRSLGAHQTLPPEQSLEFNAKISTNGFQVKKLLQTWFANHPMDLNSK